MYRSQSEEPQVLHNALHRISKRPHLRRPDHITARLRKLPELKDIESIYSEKPQTYLPGHEMPDEPDDTALQKSSVFGVPHLRPSSPAANPPNNPLPAGPVLPANPPANPPANLLPAAPVLPRNLLPGRFFGKLSTADLYTNTLADPRDNVKLVHGIPRRRRADETYQDYFRSLPKRPSGLPPYHIDHEGFAVHLRGEPFCRATFTENGQQKTCPNETPRKTNASSHRKDHTEKHGLKFHKLKQGHPTALEQRETEYQYRKLYKAARGWPVNSNGSPSRNALSHKSLKNMAPKLSRNLKGKLGAVPKNSRRDPSGPAIRTVLGVKATKCDYCQWADRECCKSWADHDTCMYLGQFTWM